MAAARGVLASHWPLALVRPMSDVWQKVLDMQAVLQEHADPDAPRALRITPECPLKVLEHRRVRGRMEAWIHPEQWCELLTAQRPDGTYAVTIDHPPGNGLDSLAGLPVYFGPPEDA